MLNTDEKATKLIRDTTKKFFEGTYKEKLYLLLGLFTIPFRLYKDYLKFNGHGYTFIDRSQGHDKLLYVLAGYEPDLWSVTLSRVERHTSDDIDICIIASGTVSEKLRDIAADNGWSYYASSEGRIGQDQNIVIDNHPEAEYIYKLDEDMVIGGNFCSNLRDTYDAATDEKFDISFVAPVININHYSYRIFLSEMNILDEFETRFGQAELSGYRSKAYHSDDVARYLWNQSLPFDETVDRFTTSSDYTPVTYRFSIGAMMFPRVVWDTMGGFEVSHEDMLSSDERSIAEFGLHNGYTPIVAYNTFAGHLSYKPQKEAMQEMWETKLEEAL